MKKRSKNAQQVYDLAVTALSLLETSAQTLLSFVLAPTNASGFVMAAKEYVHTAWLPFFRGWREFWSGIE
jgi:hypothetical protein